MPYSKNTLRRKKRIAAALLLTSTLLFLQGVDFENEETSTPTFDFENDETRPTLDFENEETLTLTFVAECPRQLYTETSGTRIVI